MEKACIIFNPTARGEKAQRFRHELDALGSEFTLKPTDAAGAARRLARQSVEEGYSLVVAAGGDGTVNEVANGISDHAQGWQRVRMGVIPLGTVNVLAKEFKLPTRLSACLDLLRTGASRPVDLHGVEYTEGEGNPQRRLFTQLAGAGLDSRAIERVQWHQKKRFGSGAYVAAGISALFSSGPTIQVRSPERCTEGQLVLIGNGRLYGGHFAFFPEADPSDGKLDVTVFRYTHWTTLCRVGLGWITGSLFRFCPAERWQTQEVSLSCAESVPFELDGDNIGKLPATFKSSGLQMQLVVPKSQG